MVTNSFWLRYKRQIGNKCLRCKLFHILEGLKHQIEAFGLDSERKRDF